MFYKCFVSHFIAKEKDFKEAYLFFNFVHCVLEVIVNVGV